MQMILKKCVLDNIEDLRRCYEGNVEIVKIKCLKNGGAIIWFYE